MPDEPLPDIQSQLNSAMAGEVPTTPIEQLGATEFEKAFIAASNVPAPEPAPEIIAPAAEPAPAPEPEPELEPAPELSARYRFASDEDRAVATMAKAEGISLVEAGRRYAQANTAAPAADAPPPVETVLASKESRLDEINATLEQMVEAAGEIGLTVTPDVFKLQKEQAALLREIPQLQREQERNVDEADFSFDQTERSTQTRVFDLFPDANVEGTPLYEGIRAEVARATRSQDPILSSPKRTLLIAAQVAAELGIAPATASTSVSQAAPAPTPAPQASPPQRAFHPAPSGVASEAQRITVSTAPVSPLDKFKAVATSKDAGLDTVTSALAGFFGPSKAQAGGRF